MIRSKLPNGVEIATVAIPDVEDGGYIFLSEFYAKDKTQIAFWEAPGETDENGNIDQEALRACHEAHKDMWNDIPEDEREAY